MAGGGQWWWWWWCVWVCVWGGSQLVKVACDQLGCVCVRVLGAEGGGSGVGCAPAGAPIGARPHLE